MEANKKPITILITIEGDKEGDNISLLQAEFQPEMSWESAMEDSDLNLLVPIFADILRCLEIAISHHITGKQTNESESERTELLDSKINCKGSTTLQ